VTGHPFRPGEHAESRAHGPVVFRRWLAQTLQADDSWRGTSAEVRDAGGAARVVPAADLRPLSEVFEAIEVEPGVFEQRRRR
jgi:hypothetical protein